MPNENSLRILVVTSRPLVDPNGKPIVLLDVAEERRRIRDALTPIPDPSPEGGGRDKCVVRVHFLPDATTGAVNDALADAWDVVHITGHGAPDGRLWFEDEFGVGQLVHARDLAQMFGKRLPRVVVLSLCFSGRNAPDALRQAGVGSVVAINADVQIGRASCRERV